MNTAHGNTGNTNACKPASDKRAKRLMINCTPAEFSAYVRAAGLQGVPMQRWIRERLAESAK